MNSNISIFTCLDKMLIQPIKVYFYCPFVLNKKNILLFCKILYKVISFLFQKYLNKIVSYLYCLLTSFMIYKWPNILLVAIFTFFILFKEVLTLMKIFIFYKAKKNLLMLSKVLMQYIPCIKC